MLAYRSPEPFSVSISPTFPPSPNANCSAEYVFPEPVGPTRAKRNLALRRSSLRITGALILLCPYGDSWGGVAEDSSVDDFSIVECSADRGLVRLALDPDETLFQLLLIRDDKLR